MTGPSDPSGLTPRTNNGLINHPAYVNTVILALVAVHAIIASRWAPLDVFGDLARRGETGTLVTLHVSTASIASLVAGFAGVVVIFGLTSESPRFRRLRLRAGRNLRSNWTSVVTAAFLGAFIAWTDVVLTILGREWAAAVGTEAAILLCAHAAARLRWLLRRLADVVGADDATWARELRTVNPATLFPSPGEGTQP